MARALPDAPRARLQFGAQEDGEDVLVVRMKNPKEYPEGKLYREAVYKTGAESDVLNGGNAWREYLEGDALSEDSMLQDVHVFRNPGSGEEYWKTEFQEWCTEKFSRVGLTQFGPETHRFRIGGATTLVELEGEAAARRMGGWIRRAMMLHKHMSRSRRVTLGSIIATDLDIDLRGESRPVG